MEEDKNIAKTPSPKDYQGLRDYGLEYIRKIGSRHWTDFNVHDPGVTILEALTLGDLSEETIRQKAGSCLPNRSITVSARSVSPGDKSLSRGKRSIVTAE